MVSSLGRGMCLYVQRFVLGMGIRFTRFNNEKLLSSFRPARGDLLRDVRI